MSAPNVIVKVTSNNYSGCPRKKGTLKSTGEYGDVQNVFLNKSLLFTYLMVTLV